MSRFDNIDKRVNLLFDEAHFAGTMTIDEFLDFEEENCNCEGRCECEWQ